MIYKHRLVVSNRKSYDYKVLDFKSITKHLENLGVKSDGFIHVSTFDEQLETKGLKEISGLFCPSDKLYITCVDGFLYVQSQLGFKRIFDLDGEKINFCIKMDGLKIKGDLFFTDTKCVLVDLDGWAKILAIPSCDTAEVYAGMLFMGKDYKVNFSVLLDASDFSLGNDRGGYITIERSCGKIVKLIKCGKVLKVICERAVCDIYAYGDNGDYTLTQIAINPCADKIKSAALVDNDKLLIQIGEKLYFLTDEKFSLADTIMNNGGYHAVGDFISDGINCLLSVKQKRTEKYGVFCRMESGTECVVSTDNAFVSRKGHVIVSGKICRIKKDIDSGEFFWQSIPLDFDLIENKAILSVMTETDGNIKLSICGERSNSVLCLKKGYNIKKINAEGQSFTIKLSGKSGANLKSMKFKYAKKGE